MGTDWGWPAGRHRGKPRPHYLLRRFGQWLGLIV